MARGKILQSKDKLADELYTVFIRSDPIMKKMTVQILKYKAADMSIEKGKE